MVGIPAQINDAVALIRWAESQAGVANRRGNRVRDLVLDRKYVFEKSSQKSLLHLLREDAGLIGTKEGCAE